METQETQKLLHKMDYPSYFSNGHRKRFEKTVIKGVKEKDNSLDVLIDHTDWIKDIEFFEDEPGNSISDIFYSCVESALSRVDKGCTNGVCGEMPHEWYFPEFSLKVTFNYNSVKSNKNLGKINITFEKTGESKYQTKEIIKAYAQHLEKAMEE